MIEIVVRMLPPVEFSPNWRGHWGKRYRAGKDYKAAVGWCAKEAMQKHPDKSRFPFGKVELELLFIVAEERVRDADNWLARQKAGQDALVEVGLIAKDDSEHLTVKSIKFEVDRKRAPATVIRVTEVGEDKKIL